MSVSSRPEANSSAALDLSSHGDRPPWAEAAQHPRLDLAVNLNPMGPPEELSQWLAHWDPVNYPDPYGDEAAAVWARHLGVGPASIMLGNGATELLWLLALECLCGEQQRIGVSLEPTFSEFRRACTAYGVKHLPVATVELSHLHQVLLDTPAAWVYLGQPNNPSGKLFEMAELCHIARELPQHRFVWDESFLQLSQGYQLLWADVPPNVVRLRSLTKDYALAGVRLGYLVGEPSALAQLRTIRPPWALNAFALAVAGKLPALGSYLARSREQALTRAKCLGDSLRSAGFSPLPSGTFFMQLELAQPATKVGEMLETRFQIRVRDCTSFGQPNHLRVCAKPGCEELSERLLQLGVRGAT